MSRLVAVYPISGEDTNALPVRALNPAIAFYQKVLRFSVIRSDSTTGILSRDAVEIGLIVDAEHDPKKAGSVAFEVDDLDEMHRELQRSGARPGELGVDEWGGRSHRTFFVREDGNGYCYCFYETSPAGQA